MPLIIAALWGALIPMLGSMVGRILISLGIGYATFTGVDATFAFAKSAFLSGMSGMPATALQLAGTMKVGVCVSMLISALTVRLIMNGLVAGSMRRMVVK